MNDRPLHIAIIGAGPAGSVAAIRMSQLGHRVTLFEKSSFPRDKVCGECLSATGIGVLQRLGVAAAIERDTSPQVLRFAAAVATDASRVVLPLPQVMWGLTRRTMDVMLAGHARACGVNVQLETSAALRDPGVPPVSGTQVPNDGRDAHATTIRTRSADGTVTDVNVDLVLLADGKGQSIARVDPTGDFGVKAHFRNVAAPRDTIELVALPNGSGYAGLAAVDDGLWNAAWSVPSSLLKRHRGDVDAVFVEAVASSATLRQRFASAKRVGPWLTCPLPRHAVRRRWPANVIPLGNAAAALEPVGGEGMGLAMRSAEMAADAIDAAHRANVPLNLRLLRGRFDQLWRTRRAACRVGAVALSHPIWGPLTVGLARRSRTLASAGLALVGK